MSPLSQAQKDANALRRREKSRAERVRDVFAAIETASAKQDRISTYAISRQTGWSEGLVTSTIRLINRTMNTGYDARGHTQSQASRMIEYAPPIPNTGIKGGWRIAASWEDRARWALTLHKHAATRVVHLAEEADVAEALWPGKAPAGLGKAYRKAIKHLDVAGGLIDSLRGVKGKVPKVKAVKRARILG